MNTKTAKAAVEPVRQRTQYSCMAASMTMCLKALGYDSLDEDQVNRVMGAQPMKGAAWEQALACAQHYGCRATLTMPATVEQLKAWTDAGIPIMIAWNPEGRPWSHASVVFDVDADLNVYVADPNIPNPKETVRVVPEAEFYGKWYEKFPDYLVRRPAMAVEREITIDGKQVAPRTASARSINRVASMSLAGKATQNAPKTQEEKRQKDRTVTVEKGTPANDVARGLIERGTKGQGSHKNKQDYDRGRARQPKHRNQDREASGPVTWQKTHTGFWDYHDKALGVYAHIALDHKKETVRDTDIPDLDYFADPELLADGIPDLEEIYSHAARNWNQWQKQGWWPKPVDVPGLHLVVFYEPTRHAFEAWFKPNEMAKAQAWGTIAVEKIGNRKYPSWMTPLVENPKWVRKLGAFAPDVSNGWARAAQHLLDANKDTTQDALHYRAYLRAVIRGQSEQMTHLNKQYPGSHQAQLDLIDLFGTGKFAAYSGNPDGKPIYPVEIDHGEVEALSGGWDVMKRLQDQYRIEQGGEARENQETRLARLNANTPTEVERTERLARRFFATMNGGLR